MHYFFKVLKLKMFVHFISKPLYGLTNPNTRSNIVAQFTDSYYNQLFQNISFEKWTKPMTYLQ